MTAFKSRWQDWQPSKTSTQGTDRTDRRAFVSSVSTTPRRSEENPPQERQEQGISQNGGNQPQTATADPFVSSVSASPGRLEPEIDPSVSFVSTSGKGLSGDGGPDVNNSTTLTASDTPTQGTDRTDRSPPAADPGPGADAECWRDWYGERAAIREFDGCYTRAEAEALAFEECVDRWHLINGKRPDPTYCSGCGNIVAGRAHMELPDGARVHVDPHHTCLRAYGDKWRGEAEAALAEVGIVRKAT